MKQITVNIENEVGVIAGITGVLSKNGINILSLSTEVMEDSGVIFITTEDADHDKALWWLADAGYKAMTDETVVITMPDEPGAQPGASQSSRAIPRPRHQHSEPPHHKPRPRTHHRIPQHRQPRQSAGTSQGSTGHNIGTLAVVAKPSSARNALPLQPQYCPHLRSTSRTISGSITNGFW